jgi:formylglycine-generating enzyme required for sulfatase activity
VDSYAGNILERKSNSLGSEGGAEIGAWQLVQRMCELPGHGVVPAGEYEMGSNDNEATHPEHFVVIQQPFAAGKYAVTSDEWGACFAHGVCPFPAVENDAVHVSWDADARNRPRARFSLA